MRGLDCLDYRILGVILIVITTSAEPGKQLVLLFAQKLGLSNPKLVCCRVYFHVVVSHLTQGLDRYAVVL